MSLERISFGCVPHLDDEHARERLLRLCLALGQALGIPVLPHGAISPTALASAFGAGAVDLVWASPTLVLLSPELRACVPIVSAVREGAAHYHGVLFVRRDSPIRNALGLRGGRAAWVAPTSAAGYIFPRATLASQGLDPHGLFSQEVFLHSHGAVARAVLDGNADVGATFAIFEGGEATRPLLRAGFSEVAATDDARIVLATPPIPADMLVASPRLVNAIGASAIADALHLLPQAPKLREAVRDVLGAEDFARCMPRLLDALRAQLDDARALGALD
ncbi:MAG: phosphate/phosphite/phosphonate ABC transporter substrate-binding protein [Sandaracinaceae bacterium]|nr:phosphate/phosphite/phosphonate ABC transporter substrate-binding protein [Sandaracinaceae bacterium]